MRSILVVAALLAGCQDGPALPDASVDASGRPDGSLAECAGYGISPEDCLACGLYAEDAGIVRNICPYMDMDCPPSVEWLNVCMAGGFCASCFGGRWGSLHVHCCDPADAGIDAP
jgi:hypothetical protein